MNFGKKLQYDFLKMMGGSKAVWNFSENSSVLEAPPVPKLCCDRVTKFSGMESERERSKSAWGKNGEEKRPKLVQALRSKEAVKPDDEGRCRYFNSISKVVIYHCFMAIHPASVAQY